ncbi:PLD nuclease N-terminal domain-containing protein [Jannaschia sp. R86511]|uniref:PLD nuclease N-terminal domain-containing protein n=1 Tax=Jannaschia sp. R86511 TaxID=3093853 RepID=UPI0036D39C8E
MRSLIIPALVLAFTVYCVIDVVRSEESDIRGLPKIMWVFVVLLFPLAGGAVWFIAGRPRGTRPPGAERLSRPKPRVLGPDDDPDFLRTIDRPGAGPDGGASSQDPAPEPDRRSDDQDDPTGPEDRRP